MGVQIGLNGHGLAVLGIHSGEECAHSVVWLADELLYLTLSLNDEPHCHALHTPC